MILTAPGECIFCRIVSGQVSAKPVAINDPYLEGEVFAFDDLNPKAPHHVLIVPRAHIGTANDLRPEHASLVGKMVLAARTIARERGFASAGYRLVLNTNAQAGQSVFHIHLHLLGGRPMGWPPG